MHSMKKESQITSGSPGSLKAYILAARPQTLIAGISPVVIGTCLSYPSPLFSVFIFISTLCFTISLQIGTNFANDYFDFIKGADHPGRTGPKRATQEGWIAPFSMLKASLAAFAIAFLCSIPLIRLAGFWSCGAVLLFIALGILYTGGPKPLAYIGLGDLFVLIFFGPIPTMGSYLLQTSRLDLGACILGLAPGLISMSILIANNLRDEHTDRAAGKKTLVVLGGNRFGKWEYLFSLCAASCIPALLVVLNYLSPIFLILCFVFPLFLPSIMKNLKTNTPEALGRLLSKSALILGAYTLLFCVLQYGL